MKFNPASSGHLSPAQEAVLRFLGNTRHWRTPYEVAWATGIKRGTAAKIIRQILKVSLVVRRKRNWVLMPEISSISGKHVFAVWLQRRRDRENRYRRAGVEPLERKLIRRIGAKRTREVFRPRGKATPQPSHQEHVPRESNQL